MTHPLNDVALDQLFRSARTHNAWLPREVSDAQLRQVYDLAKMAPTSANCSPARIVFVKSPAAKEKLAPALADGNRAKTLAAPVTAIVGTDEAFYEHLPKLFPHADARSWFAGNKALAEITAFRNGTLQGAYLILAARALGLDCGPMSGFDNAVIDRDLLAPHGWKSNFLVALGYADKNDLPPRRPRLEFDLACAVL